MIPISELSPNFSVTDKGSLRISGKSIPLESDQIIPHVSQWLNSHPHLPKGEAVLEIDLTHLNGKSLRTLLAIFVQLKQMNDNGNAVRVDWHIPQGADDMMDIGETLLENFQIPHHIHIG